MPAYIDPMTRFVRVLASGCWTWTGPVDKHGYAKMGRTSGHRWSYAKFIGPLTPQIMLDHTCHTADLACAGGRECMHRRCINPTHLEPVTNRENVMRGRSFAAIHAAKTKCPRGHEYDRINEPPLPPHRWCHVCRVLLRAERRQAAKSGVA